MKTLRGRSEQRRSAAGRLIRGWQFIIAKHSPIPMTFPGASIVSFDEPRLPAIPLEQTSHFQLTRDILNSPATYWKHLRRRDPA